MTYFLTATAIGMVLAGAAIAQPAPPAPPAPTAHPAPMAHPMHDKVITRGEVSAMVRDHFGRLDTDKDGAITTAEVTARRAKTADHAIQLGKVKHPGGAWQGENMMRDPAAAFDRLDANKDGMISRDEFAKGRDVRIEKRIAMREGGHGADAAPGAKHKMRMHHMGGGGMGGGHMIVMADTDKDGRITLAEAEAMALKHFDQMDANRDGQVTPEERRAARPMMMKMHMAPKAG